MSSLVPIGGICQLSRANPNPFSDVAEAGVQHDGGLTALSSWKNLPDVVVDTAFSCSYNAEHGGWLVAKEASELYSLMS